VTQSQALGQHSWPAEEGRNASHDECQEMEWGLHGDRDIGGFEAAIRV
jgi:hypothetical protein